MIEREAELGTFMKIYKSVQKEYVWDLQAIAGQTLSQYTIDELKGMCDSYDGQFVVFGQKLV